jgi:type III secretory pathway component EscV
VKYQKIEEDMLRTSNVNIKEIRKIQDDVSLKIDLKLKDLEQDYTFEHKKLLNTVNDHIEVCNKTLKNQTINLESISNIMDSFEQRATKLGIENEEIEKNISNLGQNNLSSSVFSNGNENVVKVTEFESRLDTLTEKVNHFVQNVMVVRSLPQKVMIMQRKLAELEQKIKS